jgi:hypothetical protein
LASVNSKLSFRRKISPTAELPAEERNKDQELKCFSNTLGAETDLDVFLEAEYP